MAHLSRQKDYASITWCAGYKELSRKRKMPQIERFVAFF